MYHVLISHTLRCVLTTTSASQAMDFIARWRLDDGVPIVIKLDNGRELSDDELHRLAAKEFDLR